MNETKIFGVGLQRTGTTSLTRALDVLGYRTIHGPWALLQNPQDELIHQFDAFTDNPVPLIYKQMDTHYPGSKFICTIRDIESWISSVQWLFKHGSVEYDWNSKPHIHDGHRLLYGTTEFDEALFRQVFVDYHQEVFRYFDGRTEDFTALNFSEGDGWPELCSFLGDEIPDLPFPRSNKSGLLRTARSHVEGIFLHAGRLKRRWFS